MASTVGVGIACGGSTYFIHWNNVGSSTQITSAAGGLDGDELYYPWGQEWKYDNEQGSWWQFYASLSRFQPDLGLYRTSHRFYSPDFARWLSPDPLGGDILNPQSLNRYAYALNNPATLNDPLGLYVSSVPPPYTIDVFVGALAPRPEIQYNTDLSDYEYYCGLWGHCSLYGNGSSFGSRPGGGGGAPNVIKWPQLKNLVAANNESEQCDELIDCIVFRESHLGKGGVKSGLNAGFNADAISPIYHAKGLMQVEPISLKDVLTNGLTYSVSANTVNRLWGKMFNPALNIEAGSAELQLKINRNDGNVQEGITAYGPISGDPDYAEDVRNCVTKMQSGDVPAAYKAATEPSTAP